MVGGTHKNIILFDYFKDDNHIIEFCRCLNSRLDTDVRYSKAISIVSGYYSIEFTVKFNRLYYLTNDGYSGFGNMSVIYPLIPVTEELIEQTMREIQINKILI